jgi:hypothetical protein
MSRYSGAHGRLTLALFYAGHLASLALSQTESVLWNVEDGQANTGAYAATITVDLDKRHPVPPNLYGIFFEEVSTIYNMSMTCSFSLAGSIKVQFFCNHITLTHGAAVRYPSHDKTLHTFSCVLHVSGPDPELPPSRIAAQTLYIIAGCYSL